ncbi:hypothetical protein LSUE1_G002032 [Lachnellula suecica]|uniref:Uncharacterized protein n=1 Tax=Lachnellula suecica TaxID=602035 RepID=A0A8T9CF01_9HELO|nr:hypothetical protein LSUE1_G002032 [Lachnellula suecica]
MVNGILCAASGVSGIIMPFAIEALFISYGYQVSQSPIVQRHFVLSELWGLAAARGLWSSSRTTYISNLTLINSITLRIMTVAS